MPAIARSARRQARRADRQWSPGCPRFARVRPLLRRWRCC